MRVNTRLFGEIDIVEDKIIELEKGLIGFSDMTKFTLIFDEEKKDDKGIMWLQSLDETQFALPVICPERILPDYNPTINDELLEPLGELTQDNLFVLVTITVPSEIEKMTVNLKAPIIINTDNRKGGQLIVEDKSVQVRYPVYELLKGKKAGE